MSYSRWSHSYWYTYWAVGTDVKEEQLFEICGCLPNFGSISFSYYDLKNNIDSCVNYVRTKLEESGPEGLPTEEEYQELKTYMTKFVENVDRYYDRKEMLKRIEDN